MKRFVLLLALVGCGAEDRPHTITVHGPGRVWSPDTAVTCAGRCTFEAPARLHAAPEPALVAWSNGCEGLACEVDGDVTVTFEAPSCTYEGVEGVALYGQSLALGTQGVPALTSTAAFGDEVRLLNPAGNLLCDAREGPACGWPDVESPRTAIVETWRRLRGEGRFVMTSHGSGSTRIADLARGSEAYATLLERIERTRALVDGAFVLRAVAFVHGPADEGGTDYAAQLITLADDLDRDLRALTGQRERVHVFVDQTSSWTRGPTPRAPNVALAQLAACLEHRRIHCVTAQYDLAFHADRLHLTPASYRALGERLGAAMHARLDRCAPADAPYVELAVQTDAIALRYNRPVALDTTRCPAREDAGFELVRDGDVVPIRRVDSSGDGLRIEADEACGATLRYASSGEPNGGGGCTNPGARAPGGNVFGDVPALTQSVRVLCAD